MFLVAVPAINGTVRSDEGGDGIRMIDFNALSLNKGVVKDFWIDTGWSFEWRREVCAGAKLDQLQDLQVEIHQIHLNSNKDSWGWHLDGEVEYFVASRREALDVGLYQLCRFEIGFLWCWDSQTLISIPFCFKHPTLKRILCNTTPPLHRRNFFYPLHHRSPALLLPSPELLSHRSLHSAFFRFSFSITRLCHRRSKSQMDKSMLGDLGNLPAEDQARMATMIDQLQIRDSLRMYNTLVERCFTDCVDTFRRKTLDKQEETCVRRCAEKFLKHSMRVGLRFAELNQGAATPD
ncbi:unnamed protein product [Lactuca saligna]|uniref:Tim10-like domain-containing protein n=3 Tax=Lactuca TaxID=4235 RepID=A0AA35YZN3_LACSI|nr:unnamed protein product [Lactuca saligna]